MADRRPRTVAGVDSSTQSTKVEIRDAESGTLLGSGRAAHPAVAPPVSEQDPQAWWAAFELAFEEATRAARANGRESVDAISVAGQQHGCVVLDESGDAIRPAKLWNDTTTAPDAEWLLGQLPGGAAGWAQACGSVPVAALTISKLSWLYRSEPENWSRLRRVCLPHDWLTMQLTGEFVTDRGDVSGTGYWSPSEQRYRWDLLEIVDGDFDWASAVPRVLDPIEPAGSWNDITVGPGTGDNMAAALGLGLDPGDVVISIGTSGTVFVVSDRPTADPSGAVAGFADATGRYLPLVCTLNAAKVTDAIARLLGVEPAAFDELALSSEPGAGGTTLVPYFDGERTPNRPDATGSIVGLRSDVTREHTARAAVEGVVCGLLEARDALAHHARVDGGRTMLVGGGALSAAYRQVLADLSGDEVVTTDLDETVATGACVQAAATLAARAPEDVRSSWSVGAERVTTPNEIDRDEIRQRFAAARAASYGPHVRSDTDAGHQ
jgi:xylulokinase